MQLVPVWLFQVAPAPLLRKLVLLLAAQHAIRPVLRRRCQSRISDKCREEIVDELRRLVPPPAPQLLGGERIDASCYVRFLSVCNWEIPRAEEMLSSDLKWRRKYQPRKLRPSDMQIMCRQNAWQVMMKEGGRFGMGGLNVGGNDENAGSGKRKSSNGRSRDGSRSGIRNGARLGRSKEKKDGGSGAGSSDRGESPPSSSGGDKRSSVDDRAGGSGTDDDNFFLAFREQWTRPPLQPPHVKPPLAQWRHTKQGMPLTFLEVANWHPELAGHDERVRHVAYHMEHYIRRMPSRRGGKSKRCAIIMDLRGFKATMLPYVKECVDVLRLHYPGRLGAACFINVPAYFYPVWKIISPWLNEEIMQKTFFLPKSVRNAEEAILWLDRKRLPDPTRDPWEE